VVPAGGRDDTGAVGYVGLVLGCCVDVLLLRRVVAANGEVQKGVLMIEDRGRQYGLVQSFSKDVAIRVVDICKEEPCSPRSN